MPCIDCSEHDNADEYKGLTYAEAKPYIDFAESNFNYGLMSVADGKLTDDTDDPSQDEKDTVGTAKAATQAALGVNVVGNGAEGQRQKALKHINNEAKHPLGSIWDWCRRGETRRGRYRRWRSAQYFAKGQMENPPAKFGPKERAEWREKWNGCRKTYEKMKKRVYNNIHDNDNDDDPTGQGLIVTLDGKPCASWIAKRLIAKRNSGAWDGVLVSGYRTPEYSEQLCYNICGRPSCPGLCAGRSSNHCCPPTYTGREYEGACDLSLYWQFPEGDHLINNLPRDLVHFSNSGY